MTGGSPLDDALPTCDIWLLEDARPRERYAFPKKSRQLHRMFSLALSAAHLVNGEQTVFVSRVATLDPGLFHCTRLLISPVYRLPGCRAIRATMDDRRARVITRPTDNLGGD